LALSQECQTITTRDGGLEKIEVPAPLRNPQPLAKSLEPFLNRGKFAVRDL
jgi:hypothetical protein